MASYIQGVNSKLLYFWGDILAATQQRKQTYEIWNDIKSRAQQEGIDLSGVTIFDMNKLRGLATSIRNAQENFARAADDAVISPSMVSFNVNSRGLDEIATSPIYQIRFQQTVLENGEEQTYWRTIQYTVDIPITKGMLMDEITAGAMTMAADYNVEHLGISDIQISLV